LPQQARDVLRRRTGIDGDRIAILHETRRLLGDPRLLRTEPDRTRLERRPFHPDRAPVHPTQNSGLLQFGQVTANGHFRKAEAAGQIGHRDPMLFAEELQDDVVALLARVRAHAAPVRIASSTSISPTCPPFRKICTPSTVESFASVRQTAAPTPNPHSISTAFTPNSRSTRPDVSPPATTTRRMPVCPSTTRTRSASPGPIAPNARPWPPIVWTTTPGTPVANASSTYSACAGRIERNGDPAAVDRRPDLFPGLGRATARYREHLLDRVDRLRGILIGLSTQDGRQSVPQPARAERIGGTRRVGGQDRCLGQPDVRLVDRVETRSGITR
jgi:hypothetical protein